jgi:hypothetical protein
MADATVPNADFCIPSFSDSEQHIVLPDRWGSVGTADVSVKTDIYPSVRPVQRLEID